MAGWGSAPWQKSFFVQCGLRQALRGMKCYLRVSPNRVYGALQIFFKRRQRANGRAVQRFPSTSWTAILNALNFGRVLERPGEVVLQTSILVAEFLR